MYNSSMAMDFDALGLDLTVDKWRVLLGTRDIPLDTNKLRTASPEYFTGRQGLCLSCNA